MVYEYHKKTHADYFQQLLEDRNVEFERYLDTESEQQRILFGIEKRYQRESNKSNYLTHAKFRRPFIKSKFWGFLLVLVTFLIIALAVVGYIMTR